MDQELVEPPFIADWHSVRDTPEYDSASNAGRFSMFKDWANGAKSQLSKELEEAPQEKRPELESRFSALNDFIEERKDYLGKKYDLAYRTTKLMEDGYNEDLLAEFRDPRKLINKGFDPNEVMAVRNQIEEEIAPVLFRAKRGLAAPIPDIGIGYTMEQAKKDVWEEAGMLDMLRDSVTKAGPYLIGQGIIKGLGGGIWKYGAQAMRMMDMTGDPDNAVTTYMDAAGKQMAELGDKIAGKPDSLFPNDPRFGKYQSTIVSGAQQMPGQLAIAAIPGAGVPLSMASNVGLMYQENVDTFEQDIKQSMFEQGQEEGTISESTPFSQWEKTLDEKAKREIREKAAGVAFVLAPAQGAVETLSDKFVLLKDVGGLLPDSAKKAMMRARHARPATYMATRILTNAGVKSGVEGFEEVVQETGKNIGSAYFTGDYSLDRIFKNADTSFVGGVAGGGAATVMTAGQIFKTERALDYANSILGDKNQVNEAIQNDLRLLDGSLNSGPEAPRITDKEKTAAENRLAKANPVEVQHQRDLMTLGDTNVDKESMEFKEASRRVQRRMDEASWILSKVGGRLDEEGEKRAARYEAVTKARNDFQGLFDAHIKQNFPNLDFAEVARATAKRVAEVRANFARIRRENAANGVLTGETANIIDRSEKAAIEQAQRSGGKQVQEAEKVLTDFIGSLDSDGPGRAAFARQRLSELYPDAVFSPWFKDDEIVIELLNARERGEINDSTDLQAWLDTAVVSKKGEGGKSNAAPEKPQGLMTTQQRRDAVRLAEDNLEGARPEVLKEFNRLKEDLEFHHAKLENKDSSEADRAEAAKILPELENQLVEFIYALQDQGALADPVSSQSTNQNDQDQTQNQTTVPAEKVSETSTTSTGTGTGMVQSELDFAGNSGTAPQTPEKQAAAPTDIDQAASSLTEDEFVAWAKDSGYAIGDNPTMARLAYRSRRAPAPASPNNESPQDGQTGKSSETNALSIEIQAGIRSGVASLDTDMRELYADQLTRKLEKKGKLTWRDVPKELSDAMDTVAFSALKQALATNPQEAIRIVAGKPEAPAAPAPASPNNESPQDGQTGKSSGSYPEVEGSSPSPATPAPDTGAIVAEVQANPDQHRMTDRSKKLISRKAAVAILAQLPDTVTNKDIATLAKNSGTTSTKLKALIQLREDRPDAIEYLLSGSADLAFDLFDSDTRQAAPKAAVTPAAQTQADPDPQDNITEEPEEETEEDTDTDISDVAPVDSWVDTAFAAIKDAVDRSNQSSGKLDLLRAALATPEGEADIRERLAKMFNFISTKLQINDPVVREAALRKIFYGEASQTGKGKITSSVLQDLLFNVQKTGNPFFVKSKSKEEVPYSAWNKHQNKRKEFVAEAATRDAGDADQEGQGSTEGGVDPDTVQDPDREARLQEYERMRGEMIRSVYGDVTNRWAEILAMKGVDKEDIQFALLQLLAEKSGQSLTPEMMGWETRGGRKKVKPTVKSALEKRMDEVRADLFTAMKNGLVALREEAKEAGVSLSDAVPQITSASNLADIIELGVIDQMNSAELVNKAKQEGSPQALLPLLQSINPRLVQKVVGEVLNDGKEITDKSQLTSLNQADMQAVLDSGMLPEWQREVLQALIDLSGKDGLGVVKQSKNEGFRLLSELYSRRIGESARPVEVVFNFALNPSTTGQGMWDPQNPNKVHISPFLTRERGLMDATILHEVGHAIWDKKVQDFQQGRFSELSQKDIEVLQELRLLYTTAKAEARKRIDAETDPAKRDALIRDLLGVKPLEDSGDLSEFLNEALNHKPFQDFLNGIKDPNSKEGVSLFRRILNRIIELINGKPVALDSILQRSFELSVKLAGNKPAIGQVGSLDTRQQRDLAAGQTLSDAELENFNFERQTADQPILSSEMVVTDQQVFDAIKANGGITIDVWTAGQPGTGIVVAPFKQTETKIPLNEFTPQAVNDFMEKFRPLLEVPGMHLGGWISDDTVYLDVSIITDDEVTATALAQDGNQLATFNIATGESPSTADLLGRYGEAVQQIRAGTNYQNLTRTLQQAYGRAMGGVQSADNRNVQEARTLPEVDLIESLTGKPITQDELNQIAESAPVETKSTGYQFDTSELAASSTGFEATNESRALRKNSQAGGRVGENAPSQTNIGRYAARNSRTDVTQGTELTGDGRSFADFFAKVTGNKDARFIPVNPYRPAIPLGPSALAFKATRDKYRGNFDAHIATSIPGFDEVQAVVGSALLNTFGQTGADVLDIGTSEGGLIKALADSSEGRIQSVGIDPNKAMLATFVSKPQVQGAVFDFSAFGSAEDAGKVAWTEDDGTEVYTFDPKGRTFDVVHEAMVFQFISNARNAQIARVKELMKPGGLAIFEEKFGGFADEYDASEKQKDSDWKALFFTPEQIQAKQQEVLSRGGDEIEGMTDKQVAWWEMEKVLTSNFENVVQFWSSGNFRGYAASDDVSVLKNFVSNMQPTDTVFSTQDTPRDIRESRNRRALDDEYLRLAEDPEANREQLQRMVDEAANKAGYKTKVWHSTRSKDKFTTFNTRSKSINSLGLLGEMEVTREAAFFTTSKNFANAFGGKVSKYFLDTSDVYDAIKYAQERDIREKFIEWLGPNAPSVDPESGLNLSDKAKYAHHLWQFFDGELGAKFREFLVEEDISGVKFDESTEDAKTGEDVDGTTVAVFNPNQIKSADPVTYDDAGNIIPLSQRFQTTSPDIRESRSWRPLDGETPLFIPAPDEKFQNFTQVMDYVAEKYTPVAVALGSDVTYNFAGYSARYIVIDDRGRQGVIEYNPMKVLGYTRRELDAVMREELIHAASGTVLKRKGIDWVDFYEDLAGLMTSKQRNSLKSVYRSTRDNKDVGAEFFRASVQKFLYGTITEAERKTPALKKILDLFREVVAFWNGKKLDPVVREVFDETMTLMRRADKKNVQKPEPSRQRSSESVPEQLGRLWQEAVEKEGGDAFAYGQVSPDVKSFTEVFTAVTGEKPIDSEVFLQEMQVKKKSKEDRRFALGFYTDGNAISEEEFEKAVSSNGLNEVWIKDPDGGVTVFFTAGPSADSGIYAVNSAGTKIAGSQIYQALYAWAHNNGKIIGPDTSLSKVAEIRRTSQMLSSALRFGTTEHMRPSAEQQIKGWRRVERDKNGGLWEISGRLREISGGPFIDDTLDSARPRRPDGRLTGSQFNQYNEFHSDTGLATFTQDNEDPNILFRPYKGYEVRARKVTLEEAQQAWRENIGLLARKEAELIFERLPELSSLNISKDGNLFGPDTDYPGSVRALPAGDPIEYIRSLKEAIRGVDPEFAGRIGPATLARALATRYAQTTKSNPTLRAANAEGSVSGVDSFSPFTGILYSSPVQGAPEAVDYIRQYGLKPPKGQSRSLIEIGGTPLFAEIATTDKSNQRSIKRAINAMLQNTTKNGRVRMGRVLFEELLSNVWQDAHKGTKRQPGWVNFQDTRGVNRLAEILAYEVADALSKDASGVDWYRAKIEGMYSEVSKIFPELATEGRDRLYFSVLLATTSNGQKVYDNLLDALEIYSSWVDAGRPNALPENFTTRRTERLSAVRAGVQAFNNLVETSGADWQKAKDFMLQEITVGDLSKQFGKNISGERADQKLLGAMILGPKIGSFFANLNGNYSTITMDLWFTRTMNRVAGDLTKIDGAALAEKVKELIDNHADELAPEVLEQARVLSKSLGRNEAWASRPMEIRTEMDLFYDFVKQTLADYAKPDADGKTYANATPLKKLAQKIVKTIDGGEAIPDNGGHRKWMRQVMAEVQDRLQKAGIKIENADLQAILWFHEKDLYTEYGATSTGGERTDYQAAAGRIVEGSGSTSGGLADFIERLNADEARRLREGKQRELSQEIQDELTGQTRFAFSAPVGYQPLGASMPGFTPTVYTAADREQTEALSRVMSDPAYASVRNALQNKTYFSYTEGETLRVATEFIDSANGGDIQKAFLTSGTSGGLTYEQTVLVRGLALKRAQEAANIARQERLDPNTAAARRRALLFIEQKYDDMAEDFAATLMDMGSLAGQELRAFRLLADTLSPKKWKKAYMTAAIKARDRALKKDPVFKAMLERISFARRKAANDTTDRMLKALAAAAKGFIPKSVSPERVALHEKYARLMASQLTVKEEIMQAAVEKTVVDALDTIKEALVGQDVPQSILQVWEDRIRSFASEQLEAAINQRLQGGQVDPERNPALTEEQREQIRQQKIMDAWREVTDLPIAEQVFNISRAWIVSGDTPYTGLVRKAQFDPAKAKALRKAVKMSIDTAAEIRKSLLDRRMSVEALRVRLESIINSSNESTENPVLTQEQIDRLASAVEIVYNEEIKEATRAELDRIIRRNSETKTAKKVLENDTLSKLLPMVNMGALSDEAVYNAIAEDLGLPSWNSDTAAEIERKAQELQSLPEGSLQRQEAGQELMSDILKENVKDGLKNLKSWNAVGYMLQIGSALWSAGILSAPPTHIINSGMSAVSVFAESLAEATGYYLNARMVNGISHDQAKEYFKDMARAWLFAFGKDANNTSLRVINEAYSGLTRGRSKFKAERLENLSPLEMFKLDPSVAIPANKMMEAVLSKDGNEAIKQAMKTAVGVAKRPEMYLGGIGVGLRGAVTGDFKGAAKNYAASMKLVGRLMLAADAVNSYGGSMAKQLMMRRYLAQQEGLSESEVNSIVQDAYKGGQEEIRLEAINQAENEAQRGDFGPAGSTDHEVRKARRIEQLIEKQVFDADTIEAGRDFAAVATFNSDPYGVIGWLMDTLFAGPTKVLGLVSKPINPFPKTMSNLLNAALNYTPVGSLRAEGWNISQLLASRTPFPQQFIRETPQRGTPEYIALHARAAAGSAAFGILFLMLMQAVKDREEGRRPFFEIHGPGPSDPDKLKQFLASGERRFSLRVGEVQFNFTDWPAINLVLGVLGTLYDQMVYSDEDMDPAEWAFQSARAIALTTLNRNALGGASALFEVFSASTPDEVAKSKLKQLASSYPTGFSRPSFTRWAETIVSGTRQETKTFGGWVLSMLPVASAFRDRPSLNILGEPIQITPWDATMGRVATTFESHPILTPLTTAGLYINPPQRYEISDPKSSTGVRKMSDSEFYDYAKVWGETARKVITPAIAEQLAEAAVSYPNTAQDALNEITRAVGESARVRMAEEYGRAKGKAIKLP